MNIRIVFYSLFRSPVQKTVMCPSFFFQTLKIEIFSNRNPDQFGLFWVTSQYALPILGENDISWASHRRKLTRLQVVAHDLFCWMSKILSYSCTQNSLFIGQGKSHKPHVPILSKVYMWSADGPTGLHKESRDRLYYAIVYVDSNPSIEKKN